MSAAKSFRRWFACLALLSLTACIPRAEAPRTTRPLPPVETPERLRKCVAMMTTEGSKVEALPDRDFDNGCSATAAVKLVAIGIPVTNLGAVKCDLALPFARWVREDVPALAERWLNGGFVTRIESFGSFACRPVNGIAGNRMSEHGRANAIDIAAFRLRDGRRISVKDWNSEDPQIRGFLRALHAAACRRFDVVLGPDANAQHHDHFHFDKGGGRYCR